MANWWNWGRGVVGNAIDYVGTKYKFPEAGISEAVAGGPTYNTQPAGSSSSSSNVPYGPVDTRTDEQKAAASQTPSYDYGSYGTLSTGTPEPEPEIPPYNVRFGGETYTDPTAYYNAVTAASVAEFNKQNKMLTDAYNSGLLDFATYQDQIKQARATIKQQYGDAMGAISGRFSALAPDAYQSAQGGAEGRAGDITKQNYANVATQEASLGRQKTQYEQDYANKLEENKTAHQNQIDTTYNQMQEGLVDTPYANQLEGLTAPKLDTMKPMDSSILGVYDNLTQLQASGNQPAVRKTISELNVDPSIRDWLYNRFSPQQNI